MNDLDFLFTIYKNSFFSKKTKKDSLNKIEEKLKRKDLTRAMLVSSCGKFLNYTENKYPKDVESKINNVKKLIDIKIKEFVENDYKLFKNFFSDINVQELFNINKTYGSLRNDNLIFYYQNIFIPKQLKEEIKKKISNSPELDYPSARNMKRHFILHIGPTNSGKTYDSLERLKMCNKGIYLGPLRLLALEIYDKFNRADVPTNMITGEEELLVPGAVCQASTIEMLNTDDFFDIAVIDEAQMIQDKHRGYNWTRAILGICASEIHVCMAYASEQIIKDLITLCNDTYEVHYHERLTPLSFVNEDITLNNFYQKLQPGDALIAFSKKSVLAIAAFLEKKDIKCSVIYGNLPPDARKKQVEQFSSGKTNIVVSTDAIGMGINLPIKRIIFMETTKFDGEEVRILTTQEIKQIAGRAGRKGIYDKGFVLSLEDRAYIKQALKVEDDIIKKIPLGFPEILLDLPYDIDVLLRIWHEIKVEHPFIKMDVENMLFLYRTYCSIDENYTSTNTKKDIYSFITCPVDIKDGNVLRRWMEYCKIYSTEINYDVPKYWDSKELADLESYYKELDLCFQFTRKLNKNIDIEELRKCKKETVEKINEILEKEAASFSRKCKFCGRKLPLAHKYSMCEKCFKRKHYWHSYY